MVRSVVASGVGVVGGVVGEIGGLGRGGLAVVARVRGLELSFLVKVGAVFFG